MRPGHRRSGLTLGCASAALMVATLAGIASAGTASAATAQESCAQLAKLAIPEGTITLAQAYGAGEFKIPEAARPAQPPNGAPGAGAPGGKPPSGVGPGAFGGPGGGPQTSGPIPAFCRVAATLRPTSDSDIKIEVWLPLDGWNGKFVGEGNMGWAGAIPYRNLVSPLQSGYAVAGTDTGHEGNSGAFLIGHPEKMIDYAYRADHEMTLRAKAIVKAYYGKAPKHAYWVGCSLGGEEALQEARRYPTDYDGIVAGAPVNPLSRLNAAQLWPAWVNAKYPQEHIPAEKFVMVHEAALKACAGPVGRKEGFIENPEACHFDTATLLCQGADGPDCLTAPQVDMLNKLYRGPVNPRTGEQIFPGMPVGGELQWAADDGGAKPIGVAIDLYKYAVFQDPNWDWKTMDYDKDIEKAVKVVDPLLYADPNLTEFLKHGGKLMMYIGWSEYHNADDLRKYYDTVLKNAPGEQDSVRLFQVAGMGHCAGGPGCDTFEKLETIDTWVEGGKAPDQVMASKVVDGKTVRQRPQCAYPATAVYDGAGNMDDPASFACKVTSSHTS